MLGLAVRRSGSGEEPTGKETTGEEQRSRARHSQAQAQTWAAARDARDAGTAAGAVPLPSLRRAVPPRRQRDEHALRHSAELTCPDLGIAFLNAYAPTTIPSVDAGYECQLLSAKACDCCRSPPNVPKHSTDRRQLTRYIRSTQEDSAFTIRQESPDVMFTDFAQESALDAAWEAIVKSSEMA